MKPARNMDWRCAEPRLCPHFGWRLQIGRDGGEHKHRHHLCSAIDLAGTRIAMRWRLTRPTTASSSSRWIGQICEMFIRCNVPHWMLKQHTPISMVKSNKNSNEWEDLAKKVNTTMGGGVDVAGGVTWPLKHYLLWYGQLSKCEWTNAPFTPSPWLVVEQERQTLCWCLMHWTIYVQEWEPDKPRDGTIAKLPCVDECEWTNAHIPPIRPTLIGGREIALMFDALIYWCTRVWVCSTGFCCLHNYKNQAGLNFCFIHSTNAQILTKSKNILPTIQHKTRSFIYTCFLQNKSSMHKHLPG